MKKYAVLLLCFVVKILPVFSQAAADSLLDVGDKYYRQKAFGQAGAIWTDAAALADNIITKNTIYYYAANAYARVNDSSNSFKCLELAIKKYRYNDIPVLKNDGAFDFMRKTAHWKALVGSIKPAYTTDPLKAKIINSDVSNFWLAYDKAIHDTANAAAIYKKYYFDKGTIALLDYYVNKMGNNLAAYMYVHNRKKKFYASIRPDIYKATANKQQYFNCFKNLKKIYPAAIFPNVYFVIGKLNSAGTSTSNGLILGIDQICKTGTTNTSELEDWELHYLSPLSNLVPVVAHELVHFQQDGMASDTTLLKAAILEGMADFIGELISGKTSNERLKDYAKGKEKIIWADFKKEMYLDRKQNWIANGDQETAEKPADLGYWVGYIICKAYYNNAKNKMQAVYDMLHIQDYRKFLAASRVEERL